MRITPERNFMEHDTSLVIGCIIKPKTKQVSGMQHASSSDSREVHVARVKLSPSVGLQQSSDPFFAVLDNRRKNQPNLKKH